MEMYVESADGEEATERKPLHLECEDEELLPAQLMSAKIQMTGRQRVNVMIKRLQDAGATCWQSGSDINYCSIALQIATDSDTKEDDLVSAELLLQPWPIDADSQAATEAAAPECNGNSQQHRSSPDLVTWVETSDLLPHKAPTAEEPSVTEAAVTTPASSVASNELNGFLRVSHSLQSDAESQNSSKSNNKSPFVVTEHISRNALKPIAPKPPSVPQPQMMQIAPLLGWKSRVFQRQCQAVAQTRPQDKAQSKLHRKCPTLAEARALVQAKAEALSRAQSQSKAQTSAHSPQQVQPSDPEPAPTQMQNQILTKVSSAGMIQIRLREPQAMDLQPLQTQTHAKAQFRVQDQAQNQSQPQQKTTSAAPHCDQPLPPLAPLTIHSGSKRPASETLGNSTSPNACVKKRVTYLNTSAETREIGFKVTGKGINFPSLAVTVMPSLGNKEYSRNKRKRNRINVELHVKKLTTNRGKFIEWLIQTKLVPCFQVCDAHSSASPEKRVFLKLARCSDESKFPDSGGYIWFCDVCQPSHLVPVIRGSIFEALEGRPPWEALCMIQLWSAGYDCYVLRKRLREQLPQVSAAAADVFYTLLRAVCSLAVQRRGRLGGPGRRVEIGIINLGVAGTQSNPAEVKVQVVGVMDVEEKRVRFIAINPLQEGERNNKARLREVLRPLAKWVDKQSSVLTDNTVDASVLHLMGFADVRNAPPEENSPVASSGDRPAIAASSARPPRAGFYWNSHIMQYLKGNVPIMFRSTLSTLSLSLVQQFLDELSWREMWGQLPEHVFNNIVKHIAQEREAYIGDNFLRYLRDVAENPLIERTDDDIQILMHKKVNVPPVSLRPVSSIQYTPTASVYLPIPTYFHQPIPGAFSLPCPASSASGMRMSSSQEGAAPFSQGPCGNVEVPQPPASPQPSLLPANALSPRSSPSHILPTCRVSSSSSPSPAGSPLAGGGLMASHSRTTPKRKRRPPSRPRKQVRRSNSHLSGIACVECGTRMFKDSSSEGPPRCPLCLDLDSGRNAQKQPSSAQESALIPRRRPRGWRDCVLPSAMYCACGFASNSGNRLAMHLINCGHQTALANPAPQDDTITKETEISSQSCTLDGDNTSVPEECHQSAITTKE